MRDEYDFSTGTRGVLMPSEGKTRITIHIDTAVLEAFRARAEQAGTGYQAMMNEALKAYLAERDDLDKSDDLHNPESATGKTLKQAA